MVIAAALSYVALYITAAGAMLLCGASIAATVATAGRAGLSPGRRALLHWAPIFAAVITALAMGENEIAMGIIFGTTVAVLSTAVGSLAVIAPVGPAPSRWKRLWPFALAAALLVFVAGFNGLLTWKHGVALAVEGLVILSLWRESDHQPEWGVPVTKDSTQLASISVVRVAAVLSPALAVLGAWLAVKGTTGMMHYRAHAAPLAVAASLLSLSLATPMAQGGRGMAIAGASWVPMTAHIGVVFLNLCLLLPIVAFAPYVEAAVRAIRITGRLRIDWNAVTPQVATFPLAAWRIDAVVLIVLATLLLPVAAGKWNLGREEGMLLIAGYCVYLAAVTMSGIG